MSGMERLAAICYCGELRDPQVSGPVEAGEFGAGELRSWGKRSFSGAQAASLPIPSLLLDLQAPRSTRTLLGTEVFERDFQLAPQTALCLVVGCFSEAQSIWPHVVGLRVRAFPWSDLDWADLPRILRFRGGGTRSLSTN
jgi:hypothetical protein